MKDKMLRFIFAISMMISQAAFASTQIDFLLRQCNRNNQERVGQAMLLVNYSNALRAQVRSEKMTPKEAASLAEKMQEHTRDLHSQQVERLQKDASLNPEAAELLIIATKILNVSVFTTLVSLFERGDLAPSESAVNSIYTDKCSNLIYESSAFFIEAEKTKKSISVKKYC